MELIRYSPGGRIFRFCVRERWSCQFDWTSSSQSSYFHIVFYVLCVVVLLVASRKGNHSLAKTN